MVDGPLWLHRSVEVSAYDLVGTVQLPEPMHEMIAVLTAIVEHGGAIDAAELGTHLLGSGRTAVASQLLRNAGALGIARPVDDGQWTTTNRGVEALERSNVLVPRTGIWRLRLVDDPLLGETALSLDPISTPSLHASLQNARTGERPIPVPGWLQSMVGQPFEGLLVGSTPPVLVEVMGSGVAIVADPEPLDLWWFPTDGTVLLGSGGLETALSGPSPESGELEQIIASCHPGLAWQPNTSRFRIRCEHLQDVELRRAEIDLQGGQVTVDPYGLFTLPTHAVPISPWDDVDAQRWARRRLALEIDDYQSQPRYDALLVRLGLDHDPSVSDRADVAAEISTGGVDAPLDRRFWLLQAPVDWGW